jgi:hypothetical protein
MLGGNPNDMIDVLNFHQKKTIQPVEIGQSLFQTINAISEAYNRIVSRVKLWRMGVKY